MAILKYIYVYERLMRYGLNVAFTKLQASESLNHKVCHKKVVRC